MRQRLVKRPFDQERFDDALALLKAVASEPRLEVMGLLIGRPDMEFSVTELQEELGYLSQSALSQHLARLRAVSAVNTTRESQAIYYSVNEDSPVVEAIRGLLW